MFANRQSLRALPVCFFTGGVVKENGICSACFLRKRRRCGELFVICRSASLHEGGGKPAGFDGRSPYPDHSSSHGFAVPAPSEMGPLAKPRRSPAKDKLPALPRTPSVRELPNGVRLKEFCAIETRFCARCIRTPLWNNWTRQYRREFSYIIGIIRSKIVHTTPAKAGQGSFPPAEKPVDCASCTENALFDKTEKIKKKIRSFF